MKQLKKILPIMLVFILTMGIVPVTVEASSSQADTIRYISNETLYYYQNMAPIYDNNNVRSPFYHKLDREDIRYYYASYLAFDSDGYPISWEDIRIDQSQLDTINDAISQGRQWFTDQGINKANQGVDFPLDLTTPDGRTVRVTIQLNIGGNQTWFLMAQYGVKANDVEYDIADGSLTWDELKTLADVKAYALNGTQEFAYPSEPCIQELDDINNAIAEGKTGIYTMHAILGNDGKGFIINEFKVKLFDSSIHSVAVENDGNGSAQADTSSAAFGTMVALTASPNPGYHFKEWQIINGEFTIKDNMFSMPAQDIIVRAIFEKDSTSIPSDTTGHAITQKPVTQSNKISKTKPTDKDKPCKPINKTNNLNASKHVEKTNLSASNSPKTGDSDSIALMIWTLCVAFLIMLIPLIDYFKRKTSRITESKR